MIPVRVDFLKGWSSRRQICYEAMNDNNDNVDLLSSQPDLLNFKKGWMTRLGEDGKVTGMCAHARSRTQCVYQ